VGSSAERINNRREVAGISIGPSVPRTVFTAVLWDKDGTPAALEPLTGDESSFAEAMNADGDVAGLSRSSSLRRTAVVWGWH
jgi:uncharacterized membrane protein